MSCSTLNQQIVRMTVSAGALPEGFCPTSIQDMFDAMIQRIIVTPNQAFTSFAAGSVEPTSNVGPWFKDCETWFVWDDLTSRYVPMEKQGFNQQNIFVASGTFTVPDFIYKIKVTAWGAGGGGEYSGGATADSGGGGGGRGIKVFSVTPGQAIPVTIGVGGAMGNPGTNGGNTTVLTMTAGGGVGGTLNVPALGGAVTGADFGVQGGTAGYPVSGQPSQGGLSPGGGSGGSFSTAGGVVLNGIFPGGGGSGGYSVSPGGNGANGSVIIEY